MNNIFKTAVQSFSRACACGTDFHAENAVTLYTR